jgi:hypothetical protein
MMTMYAVFGPGHGAQWLGRPGDPPGSGHVAYVGEDLRAARRALADMRAHIARLRRQPHLRTVADTYRVYRRLDDGRWQPL